MNIGALLAAVIILISNTLLYPTLAGLVISFIVIIIATGAMLAEWLERSGLQRLAAEQWTEYISNPEKTKNLLPGESRKAFLELEKLTSQPGCTWEQAEDLFIYLRGRLIKRLDYLRILVRFGPSLGLMGTLIPMGTGLASLGQGDLSRLSSDLVIAFTTTVVGLAIGIVAYAWHTIRLRWLEGDLHIISAACESMAAKLPVQGGE